MQKIKLGVLVLFLLAFSSCEFIGDVFQAGVSVGMFIVIAVLVLIVVLFARIFRKR